MKRKICLFTLKAESAPGASRLLESRLSVQATDFSDVSEFSESIIERAKQGFITFSAAPLSVFLSAKISILKSLSVKIIRNQAIVSAMENNMPEDRKKCDYHAAIPEKATAVVSKDGLYSAFIYYVGEGAIIFMPLEEERIEHIFETKLGRIVAAIAAEKEIVETKSNAEAQFREHVEAIIGSGKRIAVFTGGSSEALLSVLKKIPGSAGTFIPTQAEPEETENPDEYLPRCAKNAAQAAEADLGIAISEPVNDVESGESYVTVTVADSENAHAARIFANPGESSKQLMIAAIVHICSMLDDASGAAGLVNPNKKPKKNPKQPLIIAIIGIAVAALVCLVIAFIVYGKSSQKEIPLDSANMGAFAQNEAMQTTENSDLYNDFGGIYPDFEDDGVFITEEESTTAPDSVITKLTTVLTTVLTTKPTTTAKPTTTRPTTTAKPTTTTKPTTTAKPTTTTKPATTTATKPATATTEQAKDTSSASGKFVFRVYGFGHGVGMSQEGAIVMAKNGSTCNEILTHYYPGVTVKPDSSTPATVKYGGKDIPLVEYLCRTTKREIGPSSPYEALKAQIICVYTFAKYNNFDVSASKHAYDSSWAYEGTNIHKACLELLGISSDTESATAVYIDYNGAPANAIYFSSAAKKTTPASTVWGGSSSKYPYLEGGISSPETVETSTKEFTAEELKKIILDYNDEIVLDEDPAKWITVISHDSAYSDNIGYITKIRVGNREMSGNTFRYYLMDLKIRSHCFTVEYVK